MNHCTEDLLNALMTYISIAQVEHYLLMMLIIKALNGDNVQDQLLNILQSHLDKEITIIEKINKSQCLNDKETLTQTLETLTNELNTYKDPEFISNYINNPNDTIKTIGKNLLKHIDEINKVTQEISQKVINEFKNKIEKTQT